MSQTTPRSESERAAAARAVLVDSLAHLVDEVELLQGIVGRVPDAVLGGRPLEEDRSIKELYALIAAADARIFRPAAERLAAGPDAALDAPDEAALLAGVDPDARPIEALLADVVAARTALVAAFRRLPPAAWHHTIALGGEVFDGYGLAHRAVQETADRLRVAGYRLHESRLTDRPQGLPK